tara:strand:+ start:21 stop:992 length:972 start_codon:yes stop_codon:yes gene_type:complete
MSSITVAQTTRKELSSNVTLVEDFDESNLSFQFRKTDKGNKSVNILYNGKTLYLDFPLIKTWGATCWDEDIKNVSMNLAFGADEERWSDATRAFYNCLMSIERAIKNYAQEHSEQLFGKVKSAEILEELMNAFVRQNDKYGPSHKVKFQYREGDDVPYKCEIYDMNGKPEYLVSRKTGEDGATLPLPQGEGEDAKGPLDLIKKADRPFVKGVLQVGSMYFVSGSFGVSTRVIQINVRRSHNMVGAGVNYVSTRDTESTVLKAIDDAEKAYAEQVENETTSYTAAQDSEDDEEEEVEQVATPVVVEEPKKKKKVVRRKKKVSKA